MEVEMLEDDVFFAELSKRISLLITDDDDDDHDFGCFGPGAAPFPGAAVPVAPGFSVAHVPPRASMLAPPAYTLYHHAASYSSIAGGAGTNGDGAQTWRQQQHGSKGTGVFIPRSSPGSAGSKKKGKNKGGAGAAKSRTQAQQGSAGAPTKRHA